MDLMKTKITVHSIRVRQMNSDVITVGASLNHGCAIMKMIVAKMASIFTFGRHNAILFDDYFLINISI